MVKRFQDLEVYQRSYSLALSLHKSSLGFPKIEQYGMADQIRRASKSICANIAEGFAKHHSSVAEFRRFLSMALGSSDEMRVWLQFCRDLDYIDQERFDIWYQEYSEISKMLYVLSKNWKS